MKSFATSHPQHQKGILLIVVLLIVALVSVLATETFSRITMDQRRSANIQQSSQAYYFALGAEELAMQILQRTFDGKDVLPGSANQGEGTNAGGKGGANGNGKDKSKTINLSQPWAQKGMVFPIEGGQLAGSIEDMSACFNINALIDQPINQGATLSLGSDPNKPLILQSMLERLFKDILQDSDQTTSPEALVAALRDWLDTDQEPYGSYGAEDSVYQSKSPSYLTGNTLIGSVEELRTIEGFTPEIVERLSPYLCALPDTQMKSLNVNTITKEHAALVAMLFEPKDWDKSKDLVNNRPPDGYGEEDLADAMKDLKFDKNAQGMLLVTSDRFLISAEAIVGRGHARLKSLVKKGKDDKIEVVSRRFASDYDNNQSNQNKSDTKK